MSGSGSGGDTQHRHDLQNSPGEPFLPSEPCGPIPGAANQDTSGKRRVKELQGGLFIHQASYLPWLLSLQEAQGSRPGPGCLSYQLDQDLQEPLCCLNTMVHFQHTELK